MQRVGKGKREKGTSPGVGRREGDYSRSCVGVAAGARAGDAIYGFVRQCNNPSKPAPAGPNPELRGPGNDLVNRSAITIS